jgi:hypothetical protein
MSKRLHVKYPLFLWDFNETWIFWTDFGKKKNFKYQVLSKSVQWELSCSMRTDGQTDKKLIVAFRNFAKAPKKCKKLYSSDRITYTVVTGVKRQPGEKGSPAHAPRFCCPFQKRTLRIKHTDSSENILIEAERTLAWPFRGDSISDHAVATAAVYSVMEQGGKWSGHTAIWEKHNQKPGSAAEFAFHYPTVNGHKAESRIVLW